MSDKSSSSNTNSFKTGPSLLIELSDEEWKNYWKFKPSDILINYSFKSATEDLK